MLSDPSAPYILANARSPACLVAGLRVAPDAEGLVALDIRVAGGSITGITGANTSHAEVPRHDLGGALVLPGLVDAHTHLDKGLIWPRAPNPDGSFAGALQAADADREANWNAEDVRRRMDFALRCAYSHGTVAIRTHLDSIGGQTAISWPVFAEMRALWADRIVLQAASLMPVEHALDEAEFAAVLGAVRTFGGVLGAFTTMTPDLDAALERMFDAAERYGLDLDFHADESASLNARALAHIAQVANERRYRGRILVGHCCSLALQSDDEVDRTLDAVAKAGIAIVSLPMCNLYLQNRMPGRTPRWRGVTLLQEMRARGIPVMTASDNIRDPFHAYGDLDLIETYRETTRIAHLDHPFGDWPRAVTSTPADIMGLEHPGLLAPGRIADLLVFRARSLNELLARPQSDRLVLRAGRAIDRTLPDYAELDDLMEKS